MRAGRGMCILAFPLQCIPFLTEKITTILRTRTSTPVLHLLMSLFMTNWTPKPTLSCRRNLTRAIVTSDYFNVLFESQQFPMYPYERPPISCFSFIQTGAAGNYKWTWVYPQAQARALITDLSFFTLHQQALQSSYDQ